MSNSTVCFLPSTKYLHVMLVFTLLFCPQISQAIESRKIEKLIEGAQSPIEKKLRIQEKESILMQGKEYYFKFCVHCHGKEGKGDGRASNHIFPQPRELSQGVFKFHATQTNTLPLDEDIIRTIKKGIPGTAMPAWNGILSDEIINSIVKFIKTFSARFGMEVPGRKIAISMEPPFDSLSIAYGKKIYKELRCEKCHGENGNKEGELSKTLKTFRDTTWFVYDLRRKNFYKAGSSGTDIYRTLATGLDGSPMNAYDYISDFERWHLVHFVQSMHSVKRGETFPAINKITSKRIDSPITLELEGPIWEKALETPISIRPLRARRNPVSRLTIRSVHNKKKIAIKIKWEDPTPDNILNNNYVDQSAIQFAVDDSDIEDSPFYGMGEKGKIVNIWHWKADVRQKIIKSGKSKQKQIAKNAKSLAGMFVNPFTESSVEEMNSRGIGALTVQPLGDQKLEGRGYWYDGHWNVVFIRNLEATSKWDIDFSDKNQVILAFALWDGSKKEMNSNKMVSFWQALIFR